MSKTLQWIYQLGYKHAENKLYHQLLNAVNNERPSELKMLDFDKESAYNKKELQKRQEVSHRLRNIIDDVFHPVVNQLVVNQLVEYFEKNRFEL